MGEPKNKLISRNVCCFGVSHVGVPVATVLADLCPKLNVAVIDLNPERIMQWNTKQIPSLEPEIEEMLRKSRNKNLIFSRDVVGAIKNAEVIMLTTHAPLQSRGSGAGKHLNLLEMEKAVRIIAEESEGNKIIVVKSTVPVGTNEMLQRILAANKPHDVSFQVLSMPEFFSAGNAIDDLLHPEKVLIGSDLSQGALEAATRLESFYSLWVPQERITSKVRAKSVELAKVGENALIAERLSSVSSLAAICEKTGGDLQEVLKMVGKSSDIGSQCLELSVGFGGTQLKKDLLYLIHLCEDLKLYEVADYWNQVLLTNDYIERRFFAKIVSSFFYILIRKKIAILGLTFKKNVEATNDSLAIDLCLKLAKEGAKVNLFDPKMEVKQAMAELREKGMTDPKNVAYFDDPYEAAWQTDALMLLADGDELKSLDFTQLHRDMLKPALIFDPMMRLPHEELTKIGFIVKTIGKEDKPNEGF